MIKATNPTRGFLRIVITKGIVKASTATRKGTTNPLFAVAHPIMIATPAPIVNSRLFIIPGFIVSKELLIKIGCEKSG